MAHYLDYQFTDSPGAVGTFDEAPLWSASFGLLLLKHLDIKPYGKVVDIGSGAGFPLLELAARLGEGSMCYGIDTWANANERARQKIKNYGITNAEIIDTSAATMPFDNNSIDLIVSNLGINNFENPENVFAECSRVLKPGGKLALTTNINGHWQEFYDVFEQTVRQLGKTELITPLIEQQEHRGTIGSISNLFTGSGMIVSRSIKEQMTMKFRDGSAFLNHYFVKLGWMADWKSLIPGSDRQKVFQLLETNLNNYAEQAGMLELTIPMAYIEGIKAG
jgi:ubiquinone/menaquinone biosynthesis C-methylase UbiE